VSDQVYVRPPFLSEERWQGFNRAEKQHWHQFGVDLAEAMNQPYFRRIAMVLIDHPEWCASVGATFDARNARAQDYAEGRRAVGIQLRIVLQMVAPKLFVRMLTEQMNFNSKLEMIQQAPEET